MILLFLEACIGLASGLAVGAGFVAFLTVLGIIPRLTQLSKSVKYVRAYEWSVVIGVIIGTCLSFMDQVFSMPNMMSLIWGSFHGVFIGMLAAALTEVINVFPLLTRRVGMEKYLIWFFMAIVLGKIGGSLFQWILFER
ncbi:stage V sporulation protein AB [Pontibacillus litoralis]|uniref:Stage V sporulation protein AB n=1 Tax=Pontibacillus litoralis JSM 072002 TaxID=1385512 RepID=A0A0A5FYT4_9BACI|nr:stage V sporulation protein AB [Pontibacillus litoralis]KGX85976.1 stage V sporulation protein AB [Pontibacillus litoralis JSM 072002]